MHDGAKTCRLRENEPMTLSMLMSWLTPFLYSPDDVGGGGGGVDDGDDTSGTGDDDDAGTSPPPASDAAAHRAELERERKKREAAEKEAAKLRKADEDRRKAEMSELEKAQAELADARAAADRSAREAQELRLSNQIRDALVEKGLRNPDAIVIAGIRSGLTIDDAGAVENLDETVEAFSGRYASLFATGDDGQGGEPPKKKTSDATTGTSKQSDRKPGDAELTDAERAKAARERSSHKNTRI